MVLQNGEAHKEYRFVCTTYPAFTLAQCSLPIRTALNITPETLIETFDPSKSADKWQCHELSTVRTICGDGDLDRVLLYRAPNVTEGVGMVEEMERLLLRMKPKNKKRPIDLNTIDMTPNTRRVRARCDNPARPASSTSLDPIPVTPSRSRRIEDAHSRNGSTAPQQTPIVSHEPASSAENSGRMGSETPPPVVLAFSDLSGPCTPSRPLQEASNKPKLLSDAPRLTATVIDLVDDDDTNDMINYDTVAGSRHAQWPLMYVTSMAKGFNRMKTMDSGNLEDRFCVSFPSAGSFPKTSFNTHSKIWHAASEAQKHRYIKAGYTKEGLWKHFAREVTESYGGKVPGKRTKGAMKDKVKVEIKKEEIKKEICDAEVIIIDDSD